MEGELKNIIPKVLADDTLSKAKKKIMDKNQSKGLDI
jgi:hypothetical protein